MSLETIAPLSDDPIIKLPSGRLTGRPCPPAITTASPLLTTTPRDMFRRLFPFISSPWPKCTAIAWLTHFYDPEGQSAFRRLATEAANWGRVLQFRDGIRLFGQELPYEIVILAESEIAKALPQRYRQWRELARAGRYKGGHTDIILMAIAARLRKYDYVWIIESDVDFTGDWSLFFEEFAECKADLLGTTLYPRSQSQKWDHWPTFVGPSGLSPSAHTRGFFPVVRFSRPFVETYLDELRENEWQGHYEALWPTIALHRQLQVEDIGGYGPFVSPSHRGRWYTNNDDPALQLGSFRYRPPVAERYYPISDAELPTNQLCHPIKTAAWRSQSDKPRPREESDRAIC